MHLDTKVGQLFPGISTAVTKIDNINVKASKSVHVHLPFTLEDLDELERIKAYRRFMWKVGIDPVTHPPPQEVLIRWVLEEGSLPKVNSLIDSCNLVSVRHRIPVIVMDSKKAGEGLVIRVAGKGEEFRSWDGKGKKLKGKELVLSDSKKVLCLYPYEVTQELRVSPSTKECMLLACGVPGIKKEFVVACLEDAYKRIVESCGGHYKGIVVLAR